MSSSDLVHFGDLVYFTVPAANGEEQVWTGHYDFPRSYKLVPKSQVREPMLALFVIDAYCGADGAAEALERRGQVVKPGTPIQLLHIAKQQVVSCSMDVTVREVTFEEKSGIALSLSVYTKRPVVGAGVREGDEVAILGQQGEIAMTLGNDFWFKGETEDKWVIHRFEEFAKETSEARFGVVYKLRASNNMFLSVKPNFENSETFLIPEEQQSSDCFSNPELLTFPEYCGPLRADLTTDSEDANNYWVMERENAFKGELLRSDDIFFMRHVASGRYLAADLSLVPRAQAKIFKFMSADGAGNIGFGECIDLMNEDGGVVSLNCSPDTDSLQSQLFQKVASDLPRDAVMRHALVGESKKSIVESLKFEVQQVAKVNGNDAILLASLTTPLAKCRIALQNINKLENAEATLTEINKEIDISYLRMGDKLLVNRANASSDMQTIFELLRIYLLKTHYSAFKSLFEKLNIFSTTFTFYSAQYHDRAYYALMDRKKMLATMLSAMPIETTDIIGYGLIRVTPTDSMRTYWAEFCMTLRTADKNAENYCEICFFLQKLLFGLEFKLPSAGLYAIKNTEDKFYAEFFPDGSLRFNTDTKTPNDHAGDTLYYAKHLMNLVRCLCTNPAAKEEIISGMGLTLSTTLDFYYKCQHLFKFNFTLLNYINAAHVAKEVGRTPISKYMNTHAIAWQELAAPLPIDQSQWFYFPNPSSPIAQLVKDEVFFWLSTVHKIDGDTSYWYPIANSHIGLITELIEHEAVSDIFVVTVVTAVAGLMRWVLDEPIEGFAERFPDLKKSSWTITNTVQANLDSFLRVVRAFQRWKKLKVLRMLAAAGKNTASVDELRLILEDLKFSAIVERFSAQFSTAAPAEAKGLLADSTESSPLLDSLKKLLASPLVQLEGLLYHIFTKPELRPKAHLLLLLQMLDDEIDMSASLGALLDESFSEQPFREFLPLVKEVQSHKLSLLELETCPCDNVQEFPQLIQSLRALVVFVLESLKSQEATKNFQMFLKKLDFEKDIEDFWQWNLAVSPSFTSNPLALELRSLTMEITRFYIHGNFDNRKEVLNILPVQAFYPECPQYIQLLRELDLLDPAGESAASLAQLAYRSLASVESMGPVQTLNELFKQPSARLKIIFAMLHSFSTAEKETITNNEWELLVLLARHLTAKDRAKWLKPIVDSWHTKPVEGCRKVIAEFYVLTAEATSEVFTQAQKAVEEALTGINALTSEELNAAFQCVQLAMEGRYILLDNSAKDAAFILQTLWEKECGLLSLITNEVPKAGVKPIVLELSKLFLAISKEAQLRDFSEPLQASLKAYFETKDLELTEEDKQVMAQVLEVTTFPEPPVKQMISVPLPTPVVLITGERHPLRPCLQRLCSEEEKTANTVRNSTKKVSKKSKLITVKHETFVELEKWFPPKYFEDEYLQACEKAANLIVPELLAGSEDTLIPVIETMLDLAVHRGSDQVTKDVLEIIVGIIKNVNAVRAPFLSLLKRRRYYMQIFTLFEELVMRNKALGLRISSSGENEQKEFWEEDLKKNTDAVVTFLELFQYCCDGCFSPFQEFLRDQEEGVQNNINIITLATGLITEALKEYSKPQGRRVLEACSVMLLETVSGPSSENQKAICSYPKFLDNIMILTASMKKEVPMNADLKEIAPGVLRLILALLEGRERSPEAITSIMESVNFEEFKALAFAQATQFDETALQRVSLGMSTTEEKEAFDLTILCFLVCFNTLPDASLAEFKTNPITKYISSVEIEVEDVLTSEPKIRFLSFPVPPVSHYLTGETSMKLLFDIDRESRQVKLDDFTSKVSICQIEMKHQQSVARWKCVKAVTKWWKLYWYIAFALCVVLNALLVLKVEVTEESRFHIPEEWYSVFIPLGMGQMLMSFMGTVSFYVEYFYILKTSFKEREETTEIEKLPSANCPGSSLSVFLSVRQEGDVGGYNIDELIKAAVRISYTVGAIFAFWYQFLYPFLLFQLINLNDSVVNILKSVTQRGTQLALTFLFALISIYAFTLVAYFFLHTYYDPEAGLFCETLADCFLSTVNLGMRSGGGIGDAFGPADADSYGFRLVFDLMFYICITTVLMAIVFGLIVDTFSELRDERNSIEYDMNNVCVICGLSRSVIELKGEGWQTHTLFVHNPFAYLYFLIHVNETDINDCSGIEKIVKEKLAAKDITFYPTTSRVLGFEILASE